MKKTLIRTLTFIFGLYFILEFFLPEEIGGDFDKKKVHSPAILADPESGEYSLYYVGEYDIRNQAIGFAQGRDGVSLEKSPKNPVISSALFNSYDRLGFTELTVAGSDDKYWLFYFGYDLERDRSVCWATSADGVNWQKHGRMIFTENTPWRQYYEVERSHGKHTYGKIQSIAAAYRNGDVSLFIAYTEMGRTHIRVARPEGEGGRWKLTSETVPLGEELSQTDILSLSYVTTDNGPELWIYFGDNQLYRKSLDSDDLPEKTVFEPKILPVVDGPVVAALPEGYRAWYTVQLENNSEEEEGKITSIFTAESPDGITWIQPDKGPVVEKGLVKPRWENWFTKWKKFAGNSLAAIGAFAIGLGVINMCLVHGKNIFKKREQVHNSGIFFVCLIAMFTLTLIGKPVSEEIGNRKAIAFENKEEYERKEIEEGIESEVAEKKPAKYKAARTYDFLYVFVLQNLATTVFSLVSFYMVGAAFRSFRIKSFEATLLIISAIIVLLGQIPIGSWISPLLPKTSSKLLMIANAAAYRGVILGMMIGALSMSIRLWLGLERGMFHGTD